MAKKANPTQKKTIIKKIKAIISNVGYTTTADMESGSSPVHRSVGKDHFELAEGFAEKVKIVEYIGEMKITDYELEYEDLDKDTLENILYELETYKALLTRIITLAKKIYAVGTEKEAKANVKKWTDAIKKATKQLKKSDAIKKVSKELKESGAI